MQPQQQAGLSSSYLAICPFTWVTLGEDCYHHLVSYHSRSLSTTALVCVEMFRGKFGFHRRSFLPLSSCLRPKEEGWHRISFQPFTLSESVRIVLFRKPNKPTPHVHRSAPAKRGTPKATAWTFGKKQSISPSSQMQFRWVGWPAPPSRVAIFACDVIADITHYGIRM